MLSAMYPSFSGFVNLVLLEEDVEHANIDILRQFERSVFGFSEGLEAQRFEDSQWTPLTWPEGHALYRLRMARTPKTDAQLTDLRRQKLKYAIHNEKAMRAAVALAAGPESINAARETTVATNNTAVEPAQAMGVQVDEIDVDVGLMRPVVPHTIWEAGRLAPGDAAVVFKAGANWMGVHKHVIQSVKECMTRAVFGKSVEGFTGKSKSKYIQLNRGNQYIFASFYDWDDNELVFVYYGNMVTDSEISGTMKTEERRLRNEAYEVSDAKIKAIEMQCILDDVSFAEDGTCRRNVRSVKWCDGRACHGRTLMYEEPFMTTSDPSRVCDSIDLCELCFEDPEERQKFGHVPMTSALMQFRPVCSFCDEPMRLDCESFLLDCKCQFQNVCSRECVLEHGMDPTQLGVKQVKTVRLRGYRGGSAHPIFSTRVLWQFSAERRRAAILRVGLFAPQ